MKKIFFILITAALIGCTANENKKEAVKPAAFIDESVITTATDSVKAFQSSTDPVLLEKGIKHAASLWIGEDGTTDEFVQFVKNNYISDPAKRKAIFNKTSNYIESLNGNYNEITLDLKKNLDEARGEIDEIDRMFGNYSVSAHLQDDFYANKIAFAIALNFPYYTLAEKEKMGPGWSREEWAMARLGDLFVSRVPAELNQAINVATGNSEMYIAEYNIHMGHLRTDEGKQLFPDDMVPLSLESPR
jgi:hypothetical protein